jgi:hypothetical protein
MGERRIGIINEMQWGNGRFVVLILIETDIILVTS